MKNLFYQILKLTCNANLLDGEISQLLKEVVDNCATRIKFKKLSAHPTVSLSKADDFNQTLSVDLHELKHGPKLWYMHTVDAFTRYSAGAILTNKAAAGKNFMKHWIPVFGPPPIKVFSDNELLHQKVHEAMDSVRDIIRH